MDEKITNTVLALSIGSILIILSIMVVKIIIIIKYLENTSRGSLAISIPSVIRQSFQAPFFNCPSSVSFSTRDGWTFGGPQLFTFSLSSPSSCYSSIMQVNWINESRQTGLFAAFRQNFSWLSSTQSEQHDILSEPYIYVIVIFVCCILWV